MFRIHTRKIGIVVLILSILVGVTACVMGFSEVERQKMKELKTHRGSVIFVQLGDPSKLESVWNAGGIWMQAGEKSE